MPEEVAKQDTSYSKGRIERTIRYLDKSGKVLRLKAETAAVNRESSGRISVFDQSGRLIFESVSQNGFPFHCYTYQYDEKGRLIIERGYGSGDIGATIRYVYRGDDLVQTIRDPL